MKKKLEFAFICFSTYFLLLVRTNIGHGSDYLYENIANGVADLLAVIIFLVSCVMIFLGKHVFHRRILEVIVIVMGMLIVNFWLTPFASLKWLLNWLGFLITFLYFSSFMYYLNSFEARYLQDCAIKIFTALMLLFMAIILPIWFNYYSLIIEQIALFSSQNLSFFTEGLGILKQHLAYFCALIFISGAIFWSQVSRSTKLIIFIFCILLLPIIHSSRSMLVGLFLTLCWSYASKNKIRLIFVTISFIIFINVIFIIFGAEYILSDFANNRFVGLKFSLDVLQSTIFGLGNGGYHIHTLSHPGMTLEYSAKGGFPIAPESDPTYFLASWGILSIFFFLFYWFLLSQGSRVLNSSRELLPVERVFIYMSWVFIFMGLGEDAAGMLPWFVFMGLSFGTILRHKRKLLRIIV